MAFTIQRDTTRIWIQQKAFLRFLFVTKHMTLRISLCYYKEGFHHSTKDKEGTVPDRWELDIIMIGSAPDTRLSGSLLGFAPMVDSSAKEAFISPKNK